MSLIAVVMAAPDPKARLADAVTLFNYGFGKCRIYTDPNEDILTAMPISGGTAEYVNLKYSGSFSYMSTNGTDLSGVTKTLLLPEAMKAPVVKDAVAGRAAYFLNGKEIGSVDILYTDDVEAATFADYFR